MTEQREVFLNAHPSPGMVDWLTYLDSRLESQDRHLKERAEEVNRQFAHYDSRFDRLEDLIRETSNDSAATRESVARNGVLAAFVSAMVAFGSRYFGS